MNKLEVENKLKDNKLPEGWEKIRLGEIIVENIKSRFKVEDADNYGRYPFFTSGEAILTDSNYLVDYENVFLATGGVANIKYYKGKANYSADTYCLKAKITTKYLYYFLLKNLTKINYKYFSGSGLKHLQKNDFKKEILIFPFPLPEQQKIAEILETVDETMEKTNAIIEKYKRIKQGLMHDLLTKGITAFEFEEDKLTHAVKKAFENGDHRFGREENLVSHLSRHLDEFFSGWDVDSEVEKNNDRQRPDIIIHKRRTDENLFAIEVKKNENLNAIKKDIEKLEHVMLEDYQYEDAVFIGFDIDNFEDVFKLSEKVNFILVSKNGEIKVKPHVRRLEESSLGRIPAEWEVVELGEVCRFINGRAFKPNEWSKGGLPIIRIENLNNINAPYNYCNFKVDKKYWISEGDLLLSWSGTPGTSFGMFIWNRGEAILNQHIFRVIIEKLLDKKYLYYKFNSMLDEMISQSHGSAGLKHITKSYLDKIKLAISISLSEQRRIAAILSQIDETIEKEQNYKEKLERIKQALMEDLLTGKVRFNHLIKEGVGSV